MTEQEIIEGNKIIAEFAGAEWKKDDYDDYGFCYHNENAIKPKGCIWGYTPDALKYHSSYDWLMPVWAKFRFLDITNMVAGSQAKIANEQHNELIDVVGKFVAFRPIEDVFVKMVEAIKWFNEIKSK
jgi:hypothetical protein